MADLLRGKVLVTGATGGIGHAIVRAFASRGASLLLTGRRADVLARVSEETGGRALVCDLASRPDLERLIIDAGEVDVLVANAALPASGSLLEYDQDAVDRALDVNLRAPIALARALLPGMVERARGHLVFIGSLQSKAATGGSSIYCATKFGLRGFSLALRAELARSGVGVSLVLPGFISAAGMYADVGVKLPRGVGTRPPEQVAEAVVRAIRDNIGEVVVAPLTLRVGATIASLAPELSARGMRLLGGERIARDFERAQSDTH